MAESSDGFLDRAPSDEGLYKVLQEHPNWETYAIPLGLKAEQVDYFYRMKRGDNGVLALRHWRDGHCGEDYPGTWRFLLKVIGSIKGTDTGPNVAGDLKKEVIANNKWTLPDTVPPSDCHCFTGMKPSPPVSDGMAKFNECISNLKEFYLEDSVIQDDLLEMNPELQYLPLSYVKVKENKERAGESEPVEYDDIISMGQESKRVLLQGNPGSGKSTTLRKICHDFAKSNLPPEIKVVVRVVLGELEEGSKPTMKDLMKTCISEVHSDLIEKITSFTCDHNGEGILFLFDGFDELARDLQKKSLVAEILNHKAYPKSSYIITSRPSATAQLPPNAAQQMDRIETQGFTEDKMKQFIQQWFQTRPDTGKKVIDIIIANSKLLDMCRNPLTVLIAITIASEEQMLPDRMTVLLKSFMRILGNSHLGKKGQEPSIVQWEDLEEQCSSFKELADLALHGFLKGQYVFTDQDSNLPHRPSKLDHMGLFRVTSQKKGGVIVKSYQFFHLIVQEFLSAYALSLKSSEDQTAFWGEHLVKGPIIESRDWRKDHNLSLYADQRFETIFQFYAGLTGLEDGSIQQLLFNTVDTNQGLLLDYFYSVTSERSVVVYESENEEVAKQLFSLHNPSLTIPRSCKQPQQCMWCLQHVSFSSLTIECVENDELLDQVFDTSKDRLEEVHWRQLSKREEDVGFVLEMTAKCTKLRTLGLALDTAYMPHLAFSSQSFLNVLNKSTSLQTLSLKRVQLSDMIVVGDISGAIQQLKNLSDVRLMHCCDEVTRGVVEGVSESDGSLSLSVYTRDGAIVFEEQSLHVRGSISLKSLVKFLNKSTSLQTMSLKRVQLSDMDVKTVVGDISGAIQQLKNLSDVTLEECSDELTRGVVEGLWRKHTPQHQVPSSPEFGLLDLVLDALSESDGSLSLSVKTGDYRIVFKKQSLYVGDSIIMGGISQKSLVKFLNKSTSLQTLSLKRVQLSDMAMDGFLMVVASDLTVLYVPEYVTKYIGLTQTEIIGQNLLDLTHSDDQNSVERNLIYDPTDNSRRQWRQFCVRFRTSLNTPRSPLSKFSGHKMVQISGFFKCADPSSSDDQEHHKSLGLIAKCRPIESMSIIELAIQRSSFTTTTTLDLKFTAVESRVKTLIGFEPEEMMGLHAYDFFHPSDFKACQPNSERAIKCRLTLLNQGRVVSPIHRFLTKTGDWIWVQMVCVLSFVPGTKTPFDIKVTFRIVSSEVDWVNFIEHTEAYKEDSVLKSIQEPYQVHLENNTQFKPLGMDPKRKVRAHYVKTAPEATVHHEQPSPPPPTPAQSHQQGDSGPLLPSQEIAPPSTHSRLWAMLVISSVMALMIALMMALMTT